MLHAFLPLIVVIVVMAVLVALLKVMAGAFGQRAQEYPYEKQAGLLSAAERSFLGVLEQAVGPQFRVMAKVRLADVVKVRSGLAASARQAAFNRIQSKHLDFVVCDPATLSVVLVVELDDKNHGQPDRQQRDGFVDKVLAASGVPVFHFAAKRGYSVEEISSALKGPQPVASVR